MTLHDSASKTSAPTTVLSGGDVYSSADPFATALAVDGPTVAWVGGDEAAADTVGGPDATRIDLAEDFVTPGLVTAGLDLRTHSVTAEDLVAAGITAAHVVGQSSAVASFADRAPAGFTVHAYPLDAAEAPADPADTVPSGPAAVRVTDLDTTALPAAARFLLVDDAADLAALRTLLADSAFRTHAQRHAYRVLVSTPLGAEDVDPLASSGIGLTLDPAAHDQPLAPLLAAGAQVSFALDPARPWATLAAAVFGTTAGISARAAFNAVTRFAHRATGDFEGGTLRPGAPATMVRWKVSELVVQVADERVAAWSTDPRSGTAGLPDLSDPAQLPEVVTVWLAGSPQTRS
ncbi:metal-dependent hydrolase [Brevibacterium litoralis]|uniref:metal-dependent hydrolase n=1 Tax=Brevibacterium litoralis TaxID=3138935 RepID=UPI0032EB4C48